MRLGSPGEMAEEDERCDIRIGHQGCCSINDAADARLVAARLDVPFYVCNFKQQFGRIIDYFVAEYNAGRTPNPCVRCNDWLKFGTLHDYARQIGASYVATGHHARIDRRDPEHPRLLRGMDAGKDQSYVLFGAPRERLREMLLPIGDYTKDRVRELAVEFDLPVSDKPDSQEICFVPDNDYAGLIRRRTPEAMRGGAILDVEGNELGEHEGHQHFTIGQRRGVRVPLGYPIYVVNKDANANTITVGVREDLAATGCIAEDVNWHEDPPPVGTSMPCAAQIRYNASPVAAEVLRTTEDTFSVRFAQPQDAVAPGQAVVCYVGDVVLCGGWIARALGPNDARD